jgi:HAD superfamily hydrolase (TIGR01549 family)
MVKRREDVTIKAVIFDIDGTLIKFVLDYKSSRAEVIQFLTNQGFPQSLFSMKENIFEMLKKAELYMKNNGAEKNKIKTIKQGVFSIADHHEMEAANATSMLPGVLETLKNLKNMGLKMAIFTMNGEKSTSHIMRTFKLGQFFDAIATRESATKVKPDPAHLDTVLSALKIKPEETIVVGDSTLDMKCANELNIKSVGISTGISLPKELIAAGASYLISSFTDIPKLVQQLNEKA